MPENRAIAQQTPRLTGSLYFNTRQDEYDVVLHGNPHDINSSNGVQTRFSLGEPKDNCINNGQHNDFPFLIKNVVRRSPTLKRAHQNVCSILNGFHWIYTPDGQTPASEARVRQIKAIYESIGLLKAAKKVHQSNHLQGGTYTTIAFGSNGRQFIPSKIQVRPYVTGRLSMVDFDETLGIERSMNHLYHRDWGYRYNSSYRKFMTREAVDWVKWNADYTKYKDYVCSIPVLSSNLDLSNPVNRMQSYLIREDDGLCDHYPEASWYTGGLYNYGRAEFARSCYWVDDILNGMHAAGVMKVYHRAYHEPDSDEAKEIFAEQCQDIYRNMKSSHNSGAIHVAAYTLTPGPNGEMIETPADGSMAFEPFTNAPKSDRHEALDKVITKTFMVAHGMIMPELSGVMMEKGSLLEGGEKLLNAIRIYNLFVIKPKMQLWNDYVNDIINPLLGIEEVYEMQPNLAAFASISETNAQHFLHPEQWYKMYKDFGITPPTKEQIASGLIPAYRGKKELLNNM